MINLKRSLGRVSINLKAIYAGDDLIIIISGGDRPHIGAVSYGGVEDDSNTIRFNNHMDDVISKMFCEEISKNFKGNFVITAGIHLDDITKEEIEIVKNLSKELLEETISIIEGEKIWI